MPLITQGVVWVIKSALALFDALAILPLVKQPIFELILARTIFEAVFELASVSPVGFNQFTWIG